MVVLHVGEEAKSFRRTHASAQPAAPEELAEHPGVSLELRRPVPDVFCSGLGGSVRFHLQNPEHGTDWVRDLIETLSKIGHVLLYNLHHEVG